jgi:hypothetical protein
MMAQSNEQNPSSPFEGVGITVAVGEPKSDYGGFTLVTVVVWFSDEVMLTNSLYLPLRTR